MGAPIDMTGLTFGRLTVLHLVSSKPRRKWSCKCSCGNEAVIDGSFLRYGLTRSCGCLASEVLNLRNTTHGMSHTSEYKIWVLIKKRCTDASCKEYKRYGGRGITACDEWMSSFENFYSDMGARPSLLHSIDRVNNLGGYNKENCRWATQAQQQNNRRNNRILAYAGQVDTMSNWGRLAGLDARVIHDRLKLGWDIERTLLTPVKGHQL